jgi:predicted nucleic acid-binding protein
MAFIAIYDANVLYPGSLRDLLIRLGQTGLFQAKWTHQILDEMIDAIVAAQPDLAGRLQRTRELMNEAIPDVRVSGYEHLINGLELPDPDDRHVLAAAIRANAQVIVTSNLKDFPADQLEPYDIEAQSPDEFVLHVLELAPARVVSTLEDQARALTNPVTTVDDLLDRLRVVGLPRAVAAIRHELGR